MFWSSIDLTRLLRWPGSFGHAVLNQTTTMPRLSRRIEHGYRFDQEEGLNVEDLRVETLERMRRLFVLVLLAAQFVGYIARTWSRATVLWLRQLGGKLELKSDRDSLYVLLQGIGAVWQAAATFIFAMNHPFPTGISTCGNRHWSHIAVP